MEHGHDMPGMGSMGGMAPPPPMNMAGTMQHHEMMMMHMTFFWGKSTEILFSGWPGSSDKRPHMYFVALLFVFVLSNLVEWLSHCQLMKPGSNHVAAGLVQTLLHALRVGLAYMVMLAIMSFNGGVFLAAVAGHTLGFLFFGSRVFKRTQNPAKTSDLPPSSC